MSEKHLTKCIYLTLILVIFWIYYDKYSRKERALESPKINLAKTEINELKNAVKKFYKINQVWPEELKELKTNTRKLNTWIQIMEVIHKDPWGNEYEYIVEKEKILIQTTIPRLGQTVNVEIHKN